MFGTFPPPHEALVHPFVAGRRVVDLGAGDGARALRLLRLGAAEVLAVDKDWYGPAPGAVHGLHVLRAYLLQALDTIRAFHADVAYVAWPMNSTMQGLIAALEHVPIVIYVGKNTDNTACGTEALFRSFLRRPVLAYAPDPRNTLIIYGPAGPAERIDVYVEELGGLDPVGMYAFDPNEPTVLPSQ